METKPLPKSLENALNEWAQGQTALEERDRESKRAIEKARERIARDLKLIDDLKQALEGDADRAGLIGGLQRLEKRITKAICNCEEYGKSGTTALAKWTRRTGPERIDFIPGFDAESGYAGLCTYNRELAERVFPTGSRKLDKSAAKTELDDAMISAAGLVKTRSVTVTVDRLAKAEDVVPAT